ncbi:hypothetical protein WA026_000453 [Henosepilachna vigintioctopunctata]|uniref:Structural maintenance of chromosomes protein 2 n=1 Tax=Henosepilachna vigintioctopunctata TaxID=420089 RepID=A0AAW1UYI5_9CUCU
MYIQSIVLDGFKSYGQRTEVNGFDEQFTAITGLNGSGKSNILDAICFVLGITNLTHVRAANLQDLIYKSGQAGVNKATVSITFNNDNPIQCPPGFENFKEITVTRQIIMGGKNKYLINGSNVTNKRVQDLFCSIQLNVNNPHFLIMQGKITKVLNMKPPEILAMLEEAAGTRMYEVKRQVALKTIEKKDSKLVELKSIIAEEITPKLNKLKEERAQYLEYQRMERELEFMLGIHRGWQYHLSKKATTLAEEALENAELKVKSVEESIENNKNSISDLEKNIESMLQSNQSEASERLKALEVELKSKTAVEAKAKALTKGVADDILSAEKEKKDLEKNKNDDIKALKSKEQELSKVQALFDTLKVNNENDKEALIVAQKKYEALVAGMEVNDEGKTQTLREQLMIAKQEAAQANTESKNSAMELNFCCSQLKDKQKEFGSNAALFEKDKASLDKMVKEVESIDKSLRKINFSEDNMNELLSKRKNLNYEIQAIRGKLDNFQAHRPYTNFKYRDPETNFNRKSVHGVVCRLLEVTDDISSLALETAAGGRLYNVVVDTDVTSKKLLQRGNLQQRTTFIPLNKIQASKIDKTTIQLAQNLVGKENVQPALSLIKFDKKLQPAMEFIFGNVFICKDMNVARQVTFHNQIKRKCVTLDGDVTDPSGTLSGGARQKGASVLLQLKEIREMEDRLNNLQKQLQEVESEISRMQCNESEYTGLKQQFELKRHELSLIKQRMQQTEHHRQQEEIEKLKKQIEELKLKEKSCKESEQRYNEKAKELESKMKEGKGYRDTQLKQAEMEMKKAKQKADKSEEEWQKHEEYYQTLTLEISELKKSVENTQQQLELAIQNIEKLKLTVMDSNKSFDEIKQIVKDLSDQINKEKSIISAQNKEIQKNQSKKEKLLEQNNELLLEIKKINHEIKKFEDDLKNCKGREADLAKKLKHENKYVEDGAKLSNKEGQDLERRIREKQEIKNKVGRKVNAKAQTMFEQEEKQYNEVKKKQAIVENDKKKLLAVMVELDEKKKQSLKLAFDQVSKDFGSIFNTLLPGAFAKLAAPFGMTILEGVEVKVSLGGVWKESLTELSGGQRSLAALSLILAMLLFKPAPIYILDEVDAALDLSHTQNIGNMLKTHFKKSQFVIVSLKDGMFNNANVLFRTKFVDGVSTVSRTTNRC